MPVGPPKGPEEQHMRTLRVAAIAAAASGVIVLGTSCRPDRLTAPGADGATGAPPVDLGTAYGATQIDVKPDLVTLQLGTTQRLTVNVGTSLDVRAAVRWTSLDSSIVSINGAGVATAVNSGTARVVGRIGPSSDTTTLVVEVRIASVVAAAPAGELTVGERSQLSATANDALGRSIPGASVQWASSNPAVASVSSGGIAVGVSEGSADIIATAGGKSDTTALRVSAVPVAAVNVSPASLALSVGALGQLSAGATAADGAALHGRLATWTSSDEKVARVSPTGLVTAVAPGTARVTAMTAGRSASSTVTVSQAGVATLSVSANAAALLVGQTTQMSATARDAAGAELAGRGVTWSSSNAAVATVSSAGVVTATGAGSTTITGTSEGVAASTTIAVSQSVVASVKVSVNAASLAVGQSTQASATAFDGNGQALSGRVVAWSVSPSTIASVSATGTVTGLVAGSAVVTATVDGKHAGVTVTVTGPVVVAPAPPSGALAVLPELPRAIVASAVSATPSNGATIRVPSGGDLQAAIDRAQGGDVILLQAGGRYAGNFNLPVKSSANDGAWITIRSDVSLGAEGVRVTPGSAGSYAQILTPNAMPAVATELGAHHYRFTAVEVSATPGVRMVYSLIAIGEITSAQATLAKVPHHFVFDRVYVHGNPMLDLRRCLGVNSAWTAVVDSWLSECHSNDGDSQAIWGANGPGPFTIVNNHLEGAGENIMFGGADSRSPELIPADITVKRNYILKPASWQGVWVAKNLFELKVGRRVLVEANVLEGSWLNGQIGFAFIIKSTNQDGHAPWSTTHDVTIRYNHVKRSAAGITISGRPEAHPVTNPTARVLVEHNLFDPVGDPALGGTGRLFMTTDQPRDVVIRHNTGFGTGSGMIFANGGQTQGFVYNDNIVNGGEWDWSFSSADGHGVGVEALDYHAPGWKASGNIFIHGGRQTRPPNNFFVETMGEVGFMNAGGPLMRSFTPGDYRLTPSSPFRNKGSDGTDPGVDHARLVAALAGVVSR